MKSQLRIEKATISRLTNLNIIKGGESVGPNCQGTKSMYPHICPPTDICPKTNTCPSNNVNCEPTTPTISD